MRRAMDQSMAPTNLPSDSSLMERNRITSLTERLVVAPYACHRRSLHELIGTKAAGGCKLNLQKF